MKEIALVACQNVVQKPMKSFSGIRFERMPQSHNKHVNALATPASKTDVPRKAVSMQIMRRLCQPPRPIYSLNICLSVGLV